MGGVEFFFFLFRFEGTRVTIDGIARVTTDSSTGTEPIAVPYAVFSMKLRVPVDDARHCKYDATRVTCQSTTRW